MYAGRSEILTHDHLIFNQALYLLSYLLAGMKGLEPSTFALTVRYSNQLNYIPIFIWWNRCESNTDPRIFSPLLLPHKLQFHNLAVMTGFEPALSNVTGQQTFQISHITILFFQGIKKALNFPSRLLQLLEGQRKSH